MGGKYRLGPRYPIPKYPVIVEPFAGGAGYSLRHSHLQVRLFEVYEPLVQMWDWLIHTSESEVRRIPLVEDINELPGWVPEGARVLVGFAFGENEVRPRLRLSAGCRKNLATGRKFKGWTEAIRNRVATQVDQIKHWKITQGDYRRAIQGPATYFVDPPYHKGGKNYVCSKIDYDVLGSWCLNLPGQTIVCEQTGAEWLPFEPLHTFKTTLSGTQTGEVVWING